MQCYIHVTTNVHSQLSALLSQRQRFTGTPGAVPANTHSFHHSGKLHSPCNATCTSVMPRQEHTLKRPHARQHNAAELPEAAAARTQPNESSNHSLQATRAYAEVQQEPLQQCGSQLCGAARRRETRSASYKPSIRCVCATCLNQQMHMPAATCATCERWRGITTCLESQRTPTHAGASR
jgi:hypothetical protein